jgi:ribosomal protein S12 methylthiotransferase accessory factor
MHIGVVGDGPAVAAIDAALADVGIDVAVGAVTELGAADLGVVVGQAGDAVFDRANERALSAERPWVAVELGGVGGYPVVDAAVAGLSPEGPCYDCLRRRVAANVDQAAEPVAPPSAATARFTGALAGREVARAVEADKPLAEAALFGTVHETPHAERPLLPVPTCACGPGRDHTLSRTAVDRDLDATLGHAERAIDERVGIVHEVGEAESVPLPYYLAHTCETGGFSDVSGARDAAGVAPGWDAAFMKALGEAFERYAAGIYRTDAFEQGPASARTDAVDPTAFVTDGEGPTVEDALDWVPGEDLASGEAVAVPAELAVYPPQTEAFRAPVTTGLGLGTDGIEATLSGLYEVVERDATMLAWYSTYDPLELAVDAAGYQEVAARARAADISVTTMLVTQDVDVPVVVAAVQGESWPRFAAGSAANLDAAAAAESAATEALQNWMELRGMGPEGAEEAGGAIAEYAADPEPVVDFVSPQASVPAADVGPDSVPSGRAHLDLLVNRVTAADLSGYGTSLTTRDLDALGFEAVRVLVPAAQPLFLEDPVFGERAESVPRALGFEPRLDRAFHPFP